MKVICRGKGEKSISSFKKTSVFLSVIVFVGLFIISCSTTDKFSIGDNLLDSQSSLQVVDSFTVNLSTVLLDSVVTNATKVALVGQNEDSLFGALTANSYLQFGFPSFSSTQKPVSSDVFDSANFVFCYSKYYYGDTTQQLTLSVQPLSEDLVVNTTTNYLYNTSKFKYSANIIGSKAFYPRPKSSDTAIYVPANAFGKDLFTKVQNDSSVVQSSTEFENAYKGFVLTTNSSFGKRAPLTDNKVVLGFTVDSKHVLFKMYFHTEDVIPVKKELNWAFNDNFKNTQFNSVNYDFSESSLKGLSISHDALKSTETNDKALLQGLVGLLIKVQFPYMNNLLNENHWKILKAELIIYPEIGSYSSYYKLPSQLQLYDTYNDNQIYNPLYTSAKKLLYSTLTVDDIFNNATNYKFDITNFITSEATNRYFDVNHAILIGLKQTDIMSTLARLTVTGKKPAAKLRLYYLSY